MKNTLLLALCAGFLSACAASAPYEYSTYEPEYRASSDHWDITWWDDKQDDRQETSHKAVEDLQSLRGRK
jgi:hypothetical protein